jgi:hypothetical protein
VTGEEGRRMNPSVEWGERMWLCSAQMVMRSVQSLWESVKGAPRSRGTPRDK